MIAFCRSAAYPVLRWRQGMPNRFYAHSRAGKPETWQPLEEHLRAVAEKAAEFAAQFFSADWAWNVEILTTVATADLNKWGRR